MMSPAARYAAHVAAAKSTRPAEILISPSGSIPYCRASVDEHGHALITLRDALTPKEALALAKWIIDTFGETSTASPDRPGDRDLADFEADAAREKQE